MLWRNRAVYMLAAWAVAQLLSLLVNYSSRIHVAVVPAMESVLWAMTLVLLLAPVVGFVLSCVACAKTPGNRSSWGVMALALVVLVQQGYALITMRVE